MFDCLAHTDDIWRCPENMHYFVADMARVDVGTVSTFIKQAEGIYDENLSAYVKIVLRRPFAKLIVSIILSYSTPSQF